MNESLESRVQISRAKYAQAAAPLLERLAAFGYQFADLRELRLHPKKYATLIPLLIEWLPKLSDRRVKEDVVRALSVPWAKPAAGRALIDALEASRAANEASLRWAIANALSIVADPSVFQDLLRLAQDHQSGKAREMLVVALGTANHPDSIAALVDFLDDPDLSGHAAIGLRHLVAPEAESRLNKLLAHPRSWVRSEAAKTLKMMNRKK